FLPVRREALAGVHIDDVAAARLGVTDLAIVAWAEDEAGRFAAVRGEARARVFVPGGAVPEDPATGSAALGLGVWLVASGLLPGNEPSAYRVHQGIEMGRPSLLECTVTASSGSAVSATVAGHVAPIARGEIAVPPFIG